MSEDRCYRIIDRIKRGIKVLLILRGFDLCDLAQVRLQMFHHQNPVIPKAKKPTLVVSPLLALYLDRGTLSSFSLMPFLHYSPHMLPCYVPVC